GAAGAAAVASVSLWKLFFFFLKIGAILYGSGYVLVAFLEGGLVQDYGWLTQAQLLDAIAIGQFTPGPVLSTSTFIGYVIEGVPGALVATLGIFLPSFFFVLILNPLIPRMRDSAWVAAFLDAVNVAAVALMVAVTVQLGVGTLVSWPAWVIAALAAVLALRFNVNAAWLVLGGAVLGWLLSPWAG
ncbi:MAG: chromate transporter, partial [Rhodothermales bacterium]